MGDRGPDAHLDPREDFELRILAVDDALRHAAKVVSGKAWQDILAMRSDFATVPHPGLHAVLGWIYRWQDSSAETLVVIAVFGLMLLVNVVVLPWLKCSRGLVGGLAGGCWGRRRSAMLSGLRWRGLSSLRWQFTSRCCWCGHAHPVACRIQR